MTWRYDSWSYYGAGKSIFDAILSFWGLEGVGHCQECLIPVGRPWKVFIFHFYIKNLEVFPFFFYKTVFRRCTWVWFDLIWYIQPGQLGTITPDPVDISPLICIVGRNSYFKPVEFQKCWVYTLEIYCVMGELFPSIKQHAFKPGKQRGQNAFQESKNDFGVWRQHFSVRVLGTCSFFFPSHIVCVCLLSFTAAPARIK